MIMGIISTVFAILGLVGFYSNIPLLLYLGAGFNVLENLRGFFTGQLKSLSTLLFSMFVGWLFVRNFYGVCAGVCFENVIITLLSIPLYIANIIALIKLKKEEKENEETKKQTDDYFSVFKM